MKLTPNCTPVMAGGGAGVSLAGGPVLLESSGLGVALNDTTVLAVQEIPWGQPGAVAKLKKFDLTSGAVSDFGSPGNFIAAGADEFTIGRPGSLRWSLPFDPPMGAAVGDVDPFTGTIVVKLVNGDRHDLLVYRRDIGIVGRLMAPSGVEWVRVRHGRIVYVANNGAVGCADAHSSGLTAVDPPASLMRSQFLPVKRGSEWHVAYPTFDALKQTIVCHKWDDASVGVCVTAAPPTAENWDAHGSEHDVTIAWAVGAAERPGEGRVAVVSQLVDLKAATAKPVTVPDFPSFGRFVYVIEMDRPDARFTLGEPGDPRCRGVFHTVGRDDLQQAIADARKLPRPLIYAYKDAYDYAPSEIPVVPSDITVVPLLMAYPKLVNRDVPRVMEDTATTTGRIRHALIGLRGHVQRLGIVSPSYCQVRDDLTYNWTLQSVIDRLRANHDLVQEFFLSDVAIYTWKRGDDHRRDGAYVFPELIICTDRIAAASVGNEPPIEPPTIPPVTPPTEPPPVDEEPEMKLMEDAEYNAWVKAECLPIARRWMPPSMSEADMLNALAGAGHFYRAKPREVNPKAADIVFGGIARTKTEHPGPWPVVKDPDPNDNGKLSTAVAWENDMARCWDSDVRVGLRRH